MSGAVGMGATATSATQRAAYRIHDVDLLVEGDAGAALAAVARSYDAFALPLDRLGPDPARRAAWRDPGGFRLADRAAAGIVVADETSAVLGLLDRVVAVVLDRLGRRGVLGLHAGVVEIAGRAVILAGRSGRGKTTLTLALVRRGAGWLTDEVALIGPDDRTVLPYPRAMHVSPGTRLLLPELAFLDERPGHDLGGGAEWSVGVEDLRRAFAVRRPGPTTLGAIVLLDGAPQPDRPPRLEPVVPALATMELLRGTPASGRDFEATLRRLGRIVAGVPCVALHAGELFATAAAVERWVEDAR